MLGTNINGTVSSSFAHRALNCGLVNEVVPTDKLLARAIKIAEEICSVNNEIMLTMKKLIEEKNSSTLNAALTVEREGFKLFLQGFDR